MFKLLKEKKKYKRFIDLINIFEIINVRHIVVALIEFQMI